MLFRSAGAGESGVGGVGVGGSGTGVGGPTGGKGKQPSTLTPEEAWAKHKNDDHPEFGALSPEEQEAWKQAQDQLEADMVAYAALLERQLYNDKLQ